MSADQGASGDSLSEDVAKQLPFVDAGEEGPDSLREILRRSLITGAAIFIPLAVTFLVVGFVVNFLSNSLSPAVGVLDFLPGVDASDPLAAKVIILLVLVVVIPVAGFFAEFSGRGERLGDQFDDLMSSIPGLGSVYSSFDEMSELLLDPNTESFQEVKLVEYPTEGSYVVAFKTADTPPVVGNATGHGDMVTLFMPMAPNPVMGGFVIHVSREKVVDVDMTVEEGIRSIVTSGVAIGEGGAPDPGLSEDELRDLGYVERVHQQVNPAAPSPDVRRNAHVDVDRAAEYDDDISPEHSDTPDKIAERSRRDDRGDAADLLPEELAGRDADERETTTVPPEELAGRDGEGADEGG